MIKLFVLLKPDLNEVVVNVNHLISLELYFELENPQVYTDGSNSSAQVGVTWRRITMCLRWMFQ